VTVPSTPGGAAWGTVCAGQTYLYTASGLVAFNTDGAYADPDGNRSGTQSGKRDPAGSGFLCPSQIGYSLVGEIDGGNCFQLGTSGTFTASTSGTLQLYFNDDLYGDNSGSFTCCVASLATAMVTLVDAQGFQPQLDEYGDIWLNIPITNTVDASYDRVGALTDGASLIIVQLSTGACSFAGWTVTVSDPNDDTLGAAQVGSLWGGDENNLPPLPSTLDSPGDATITLEDGQTAFFYLPPPSWAFGVTNKTHMVQIQVLDQNSSVVTTTTFTLYIPPLVLVHGYKGNPGSWDNFLSVLSGAGIQADTFFANYASCNTCGLDACFGAVPSAIQEAVSSIRAESIAATRVDVVAHSLGGVVTRWYMTPSDQLPDGQDRGTGASPALAFKTTPITGTRTSDTEFLRADNFGIGDIRRFITLGTPHAGTSAGWKAIQLLNRWVTGKAYRNRELRNDTMWVETDLNFQAIGLNEAGTLSSQAGMVIVDASAFGTYPTSGTCGQCPGVSFALTSLLPIPVEYLPVEGTAFSNNPFWDALVWVVQRGIVLHGAPPADIQPDVSDGFIPALSARNLTAYRGAYNLTGTPHNELTYAPGLGAILLDALGEDDSIFLGP
jgi:hypothetical protein